MESLTNQLYEEALGLIDEVEDLGGMGKAISTGMPKLRIEEAATRKQARVDAGIDVVVGTNKYQLDHEEPIDVLQIDNSAVRESQINRLASIKASRDENAVEEAWGQFVHAMFDICRKGLEETLRLAYRWLAQGTGRKRTEKENYQRITITCQRRIKHGKSKQNPTRH